MTVSNNNYAYRKGILLGLTMAEIIILIIFLLLLAFSTLLKREKEKAGVTNLTEKDRAQLEQIIIFMNDHEPEANVDLVKGVSALPKMIEKIKDSNIVKNNTETVEETLNRGLDKLIKEKEALENLSQGAGNSLPIEEQLIKEREEKDALAQKVSALEEKLIAGVGPPPCWDPGNRKYTEFIFRAELKTDGIILTDISSARWQEAKSSLPLEEIVYGQPLSIAQFSAQTGALSNWSRKKECRFLISIIDETAGNEKDLYKQMYRVIYDNFMIKLVNTQTKVQVPPIEAPKKESSFFGGLFDAPKEKKAGGYNN